MGMLVLFGVSPVLASRPPITDGNDADTYTAHVDANTPTEAESLAHLDAEAVAWWNIHSVLKQSRARIEQIEVDLAALPQLQRNRQFQGFGYHSDYKAAPEALPEEPLWTLDFKRKFNVEDVIIGLIPAVDHRLGDKRSGYGFPKRFTIEIAHWQTGEQLVVDWRDEDFPNPGRLPVLFRMPPTDTHRFRLKVYRGAQEDGLEFYALSEIVIISLDEYMLTHVIETESSYESPPYWSVDYLNDVRLGMGVPVQSASVAEDDFIMQSPSLEDGEVTLRLDLGKVKYIPWLNLYPASAPEGIELPGYGFPGTLRVRTSRKLRNEKMFNPQLFYESNFGALNPGNDWVRIRNNTETQARWVELTFSDFPEYNGEPAFALGEIAFNKRGKNESVGASVTVLGVQNDSVQQQTALLVNNQTAGGELMEHAEWIHGLASRKPLERERADLLGFVDALDQRWKTASVVTLSAGGALFVFGFGCFLTYMWRQRRLDRARLRKQINSDLHDDLGSKIATISFSSEFIGMQTKNLDILDSSDLILSTAKEMNTALRDVLWFTDTDTDDLQELMQRLGIVAASIVPEGMLELEMSDLNQVPRKRVSLGLKRELTFFVREVLNNCMKHAEATRVTMRIELKGRVLRLHIQDDGIGFDLDPDLTSSGNYERKHYGLGTMQERAQRIHANYEIISTPGEGTAVKLRLPI